MAPETPPGRNESSPDPPPPPLPPRRKPSEGSLQVAFTKPIPTTAVSSVDIATLSFPDGTRGTFPTNTMRVVSSPIPGPSGHASPNRGSEDGLTDSMSVMSFAPTMRPPGDLASLVGGELNKKSRAWNMLRSQSATVPPFESVEEYGASDDLAGFEHEFDDIPDLTTEGVTDDQRLALWKSKMKHYMILSSAGKPIYSRHGDLSLVNSYMGIVQTIISFYEGASNPLLGFTAGNARFVIAIEGPLYFVAISRLGESDAQLRAQLDALYMQILSTLTLPTLKNIFVHRPSSDLRKPLEGTESLLSSLADSFSKGSPSALLGALECLRLRKSQRATITNAFLKVRSEKLLYGLIVAGGKLVSVIRPRKHSLHPSDLQLIFNMLFESGNVQAGGGESWIPLCLPAFNNRGYLYMYVSFFDPPSNTTTAEPAPSDPPTNPEEQIAIILISPDKESFYDLQEMRNKVADKLLANGGLALVAAALAASPDRSGRPALAAVAPGSPLSHFLYKSRANVQFCMPSLAPFLEHHAAAAAAPVVRRRLLSLYHRLHASMHAKHAHLRVLHSVGDGAASLAWITPVFELYCVAGPNVSRAAMTQGANKVVQWAKREEERLFIIGGGVF
ncbi:trafficking protein Mon1 [Schizothecium vesticola]|uniref:Vacuolar fusion protein MON1 n=1 Tax=Schizothecium vesticola TaxID=314040 RepID=A0AA40EUR0_9PEZI|nr:trafficking protein Mon1 [Schizothecium vesticola]